MWTPVASQVTDVRDQLAVARSQVDTTLAQIDTQATAVNSLETAVAALAVTGDQFDTFVNALDQALISMRKLDGSCNNRSRARRRTCSNCRQAHARERCSGAG
jgi:septal ring factor EnvC (AmiA/AmiB activator)